MSVRERLASVFKGRDEFDLTDGSIGKPLFYLSLPIVVTNLLQTAYNLADTLWLGRYSTEALAAISFAFPMVFLLFSLGMGVTVAGSVLVAQHVGAEEDEEAKYAASQTVSFAVIVSLVLGGVGYLVVGDLLGLLGASPDVLPLATDYMRVISSGLVFMFGFFVFTALMRGYGDTITPMLVMLLTVVVNIVIDPFLIFGWWVFPELGVAGAAYATIFSRALAFVVGMAIMLRGTRGVQITPADMVPNLTYAKKIVRIGVPASVEMTGRSLSVNLMLVIVGLFPTTVVAGYGIGVRVFSVIFLPAIAVARGVETMTGQNIGADRPERAATAAGIAAKTMFAILGALGVVVILAARPIAAVFTDDPAVIAVTADFLRWVAPTFGFIGVMRAYTGSLRGAGKTMTAAAISILMLGFIRLPVALGLARPNILGLPLPAFDSTGIWMSFAVSNAAGAAIAYLWYRRGTWRDADPRGQVPAGTGEEADGSDAAVTPTDD
ncbi:MATE family efflux transporter [Halobaculum gomorrense]|uniref:Putative efflux protein, MATE family n=1 Tax=Halobaculum gomorrense TaxID=43928 RepID=A0A1M5U0I9_9EURY|nr:MATE family efflux transporter [Halobaculum gomorrense]SHH56464.1 putative efflux protein, MATE family [Halobaculum gomorrense]